MSDFDGLHSRKHNNEVQFYAFDMLVSDGDDVRRLPLSMRKADLARLLARRVDGFRIGRDRTRPVPARLLNGIGRTGFEASRPRLSGRPISTLGEGQERPTS